MKRFALLLILFSLVFNAMADGPWTVRSVPNTRLNGNDIHVSDPDGYLSDSVEMTINTALNAIRDKADVFVVTLTSIGDADPKHFATELFNYWGIGHRRCRNQQWCAAAFCRRPACLGDGDGLWCRRDAHRCQVRAHFYQYHQAFFQGWRLRGWPLCRCGRHRDRLWRYGSRWVEDDLARRRGWRRRYW